MHIPVPIGSMYGIFTYIYSKSQPNAGIPYMDPMSIVLVILCIHYQPPGFFTTHNMVEMIVIHSTLKNPFFSLAMLRKSPS